MSTLKERLLERVSNQNRSSGTSSTLKERLLKRATLNNGTTANLNTVNSSAPTSIKLPTVQPKQSVFETNTLKNALPTNKFQEEAVKSKKSSGVNGGDTGFNDIKKIPALLKTMPTSIGSGANNAINAVDEAFNDFMGWITGKEYNQNTKTEEEVKKGVLDYTKDKYGENSNEYQNQLVKSNEPKKVNPLNFKYTDTKTYKDYASGNLNDTQQKIWNVGENIGQTLPSVVATVLTGNPLIGKALFFTKAQQDYTNQAKAEGKSDFASRVYGLIMGGVETGIENLGFNPFDIGKPNILKSMGGEALEEFVTPYIDSTVKLLGFGDKYDLESTTKEAVEGAIYGAIVGGIMDAGNMGIRSVDNVISKINSKQNVSSTEMNNAINDIKTVNPNYFDEKTSNVAGDIKNIENTGNNQATTSENIPNSINAQSNQNVAENGLNNEENTNDNNYQKMPISLSNQINNAINNKDSKSKIYLGKASNYIVNKVNKLLGINVENRTHVLTDNDIRHMIKEHGNQESENQKGQIAITKQDINNIPDIIDNPTDIVKGTRNKLGNTIRYIKKYNDNTTFVVEVVPDNNNALIIKTMWKKPSTLTNSIAPSSTSKTQGSDVSSTLIDNNISQSDNPVKLPPAINDINMQNVENNTQELDNSSFSLKQKQNEIIQKSNPVEDDYHTWIRSVDDIKTFEETLEDSDYKEYYEAGENFDETYTADMAKEAVETGKITVYSSYPIKDGIFVSPSKMEAESYSGNGKVYSKEVNLKDVAWIDPTQGQYAKINKKIAPIRSDINTNNSQQTKPTDTLNLPKPKKNNIDLKGDEILKDTNKTLNPTEISKLKTEEVNNKTSVDNKIVDDTNMENKTAQLLNNRPLKEQKGLKAETKKLYQKLVDKGKYVADLSEKANNKELYAKYDQMGTARGTAEYSIGVAQVNNEGKKIGKSLIDIWNPITESGKEFDFSMYLLHKHNIDRYNQGKPVFGENITSDISKQEVSKYENNNPEFKEWSKDINVYNKNLLQNMVDAGLTNEESQKYYNDTYSNYVRIYRDITGNSPIQITTNGVKINSPIKKAKGGNQDIMPLKDSMAQQTLEVTNAIRRNQFGLELLKTLGNGENVTDYGKEIISANEDGTYSFTVFEDGKPVKMQIDEGLYESIKPTKRADWESLLPVKGARNLLSFQRGLITDKNPLFLFRNFFKDLGDAPLNSKYSKDFVKNFSRAYKEIISNGEYAQLYKALGGYQQSYFDNDQGLKFPSQKKTAKFIRGIQSLNQAVEMAPRLDEFISSIEAGETIQTAMYNAAEITTNFKRGGDITKVINRNFSNFLNASVQGFDKQFRNLTGQNGFKGYANLLLKASVWGVFPSVLNHLLLDDDEEYQELPSYIKDNYYLFKIGNGNFVRIPKGRVVSIFGNAAVRTIEYVKGNKDAYKGYLSNSATNIAPNNPIGSNVLSPFIQVATNKSWNGSDIVPSRLKDLPNSEQFDEKTDEISKWIGQTFNISPKKVSYLLDQYSGVFGDLILPISTPQAEQNPFISAFSVNSTTTNKYNGDFYDLKGDLLKKANSVNATADDILRNKYLNSIQAEINELYKEKREIQMSDMKDSEKRKSVKEIQKQINEISKKSLSDYKEVKSYSNYGLVSDTEYYLNSKNEWEKVKEEEQEDLNRLEMSANSKNNYFKSKVQIGIIKSNDLKSSNVKHQEIGDIIINTQLNDKEKGYLYSKYYSSDKTINTVLNAKIPIKEFIKFNSQEFETDYNSNGKTISNSRLNKVIKYVKGLNLSTIQKAMLVKMEYSSYNNYDNQIAKYVNSQNIDFMDKAQILKKLGFSSYDKQIVNYVKSKYNTVEQRKKVLEDLGFTIKNGVIIK